MTAVFPRLDTTVTFWVPKYGSKRKNIDLKGRPIALLGSNTFPVNIKVSHNEGWGWLKRDDRISASVVMDNLVPKYVSGDSLSIEVNAGEKDTVVPNYKSFKGIGFDEASLSANIKSWAGVQGDLALTLEAFYNGGSKAIERHIFIPPAFHELPGVQDTVIDISEIFEKFPKRIHFEGEMSFKGEGFLDETQKAFGTMEIVVPSTIKVSADTIVSDTSRDTTTISPKDIEDIKSANLHLRIKNHTPLGAFLAITIKPPEYAHLDPVCKSIDVPCAPHLENGKVVEDTTLEFTIPLSSDEIEVFTTKPRLSWVNLLLKPANGDTATLRTTDFIGLQSYAEIKYKIVK